MTNYSHLASPQSAVSQSAAPQVEAVKEQARELVLRSRAGDQNATAQIVEVRKYAKKGRPKAILAFNLIKDFIKQNPAQQGGKTSSVPFGNEADILRGDFNKNVSLIIDSARKEEKWAVALLTKIKEKALQGSARARLLLQAFKFYIKEHSIFGNEVPSNISIDVTYPESCFRLVPCKSGSDCMVACFVNGPLLGKQRIKELCSTFSDEVDAKLFAYGVTHPNEESVLGWEIPNRAKACVITGQCVGRARGIQAARRKKAPLSVFSHEVAEELGALQRRQT
jgi:hypothetical protein